MANPTPPDACPVLMTLDDEEVIRSGRARVIGTRLTSLRIVGDPGLLPSGQSSGFTDTLPHVGLNPGTAFQYRPLQQGRIRLLIIFTPGIYPMCLLEDFDLDNAPPDAALSYGWGLPIATRAILCSNPGSDIFNFSILEHVLEALNCLFAYVPSGQKIWIDSICVDQKNAGEKADQIAAMPPRIFSQSQQFLCWLGVAAHNSDEVIDHLSSHL